ncbi:hypothetical protein PI125_g16996 [Phytophthora idaei]|nr:hypothetical protein PI125_g16996 [Phytophthora idaei]
MVNATADAKKNEGNEAFKKQDYPIAVARYTEAIEIDPTNHVYFSNRSAANAGWGKFQQAADDAAECIRINPQFVKAYHRHGVALKGLKKYDEALATLRAGQRVDFNNADLNRLLTEIEPLQARAEQAKRSGMNPAELLKERGNDAFKSASFEKAIELYGEAIEACSDKPGSALALSCYNNRAACNQQLSNFSGVIRDCTHVLEYDVKNQKALLRRALAYEGLERYRLALQDIRALLAINPSIEIANKAQHRLSNYSYEWLINEVGNADGNNVASRGRPATHAWEGCFLLFYDEDSRNVFVPSSYLPRCKDGNPLHSSLNLRDAEKGTAFCGARNIDEAIRVFSPSTLSVCRCHSRSSPVPTALSPSIPMPR